MKKLAQKLKMAALAAAVIVNAVVFGGIPVHAASSTTVDPKGSVTQGINDAGGSGVTSDSLPSLIQSIISVLLFIVGAVSVVMIIIGGLRYVTSNGDQADVKAAKDTILYSIIGLIVSILAYAIVQFVVSKL